MKRNRFIMVVLSVFMCLMLSLGLTGCFLLEGQETQAPVSIVSIEKTSSEGLVDTYTIYYSDGTTSTFEITNGANGENGQDGENFNGDPVSIDSIEKTATNGLVDTYTIYYTNGTTSMFEITNGANGTDGIDGTNGQDGANGQDLTALDLYETYKEIYGDELTYAEFLSKYMSFGETSETDTYTVINDCLQSVGKVYCGFTEYDTSTTDDTTDTTIGVYTGACVIYRIDDDYTYFITNYHVVYSENAVEASISDTIYCYLYGSEDSPVKTTDTSGNTYLDFGDYGIQCEYVGGAIVYDLAIIRAKTTDVTNINENVKAVTFAEDYYVGQTATAIGNPNGDGISVTEGIVSVDNEFISLAIDGTSRSYRSIRIDTALYHGNSGGGLFNANGQLIGIANAGNVTDQNINFAIPIQIVKGVTENIMLHYNDGEDSTNGVYKITLGITVTSQNSKYTYNSENGYGTITEEIVVSEITSGSIAKSKLGLKTGDILTSIVIDGVEYKLERYFDIGDYLLSLTEDSTFYFIKGSGKSTNSYTVTASDLEQIE